MKRLLVATTNRGKLSELLPVLQAAGWEPLSLADLPSLPVAPEEEDTLAGNARAKARFYEQRAGLPTLADDSGLEVEALGGAPGVHSARFAGPTADDAANRAQLLKALSGCSDRRARFTCALCLVADGQVLVEVSGHCTGHILQQARGSGGFGYDALFVPDDPRAQGQSFAELPAVEKRRLSHRGAALAAFATSLARQAAPDAVGAERSHGRES
ncbi:MAG: RdgB/HAM1 family non-canonical purine NTP pyrophosphatase [Planctomycetota bacterium]